MNTIYIQITKLTKTFIFFGIISLIHVLGTVLYLNNLYKYMFWHENRIAFKQKLSQNQFFVNYIQIIIYFYVYIMVHKSRRIDSIGAYMSNIMFSF